MDFESMIYFENLCYRLPLGAIRLTPGCLISETERHNLDS